MRTIEEIKADMEIAIKKYNTDKINELYKEKALYYIRDIQVSRIREICNAERDGRLVIQPCKQGDKVWEVETNTITAVEVVAVWFSGFKWTVVCDGIGELILGKTVFLTKSEAEQALKGGAE